MMQAPQLVLLQRQLTSTDGCVLMLLPFPVEAFLGSMLHALLASILEGIEHLANESNAGQHVLVPTNPFFFCVEHVLDPFCRGRVPRIVSPA